jgi:hypothetical protein
LLKLNFEELFMKSAKSTGRTVGILLLLQLAAGLMLPFILIRSLVAGSPGFLTTAAENSFQIRAAVLIAFAGGALTVSLGITALPVFRRYGKATALWFLAVCVVSWTLDAVHGATVMSMLSLSQQYVNAGAAETGLYQVVGAVVASARRWASKRGACGAKRPTISIGSTSTCAGTSASNRPTPTTRPMAACRRCGRRPISGRTFSEPKHFQRRSP